ncbi:MAG: radical SAM protein, partial [Verrucomicrobiia bacterium]
PRAQGLAKPEGEHQDVEEIIQRIRQWPTRFVVLTGGEPMIAPGIRTLCETLARENYHLTIETAGTIPPEATPCHLASISPKLAHSTPDPNQFGQGWTLRHEQSRWQPEIVAAWIARGEYQLKFVLRDRSDYEEVRSCLSQLPTVPPDRVLLMPEGRDPAILWQRARDLAILCKETGHRLSPRLQIDLFGDRRGT